MLESPCPQFHFAISQPVWGPPVRTLVARPHFSLLLSVWFLETPIGATAVPGSKLCTYPRLVSASPQTPRLRIMGPRALFLLLSGALALTGTRAGECEVGGHGHCGEERGHRPGGRGRGGGRTHGEGATQRSRPRPHPPTSPRLVPAWPRGAPLHRRRLRGRHAVGAVRQRRPEAQEGAAGMVDRAGGARVLGRGDADQQGQRTDSPREPEHPAWLLQPERGQ